MNEQVTTSFYMNQVLSLVYIPHHSEDNRRNRRRSKEWKKKQTFEENRTGKPSRNHFKAFLKMKLQKRIYELWDV